MAPPAEFSQPPTKPFNIAVVGGGIAGLVLTLALLKQRIPVVLYEAAPKFGEIGAGVSFGPNAIRAMSLISPHIRQAFETRCTRNQWESKQDSWFSFRYGESCDGKWDDGSLITDVDCEGGQAGVHRAHFLDEMVKLLPEGVARFGKRVTDVSDSGTNDGFRINFADGTEAFHDAVIGCDGIKSRVRLALLGESHPSSKAIFSGKYAYRGLMSMSKARELLGDEFAMNAQMYLGRHGHILTFGVEKGRTMNVVAFSSSAEWKSDEWVVQMDKQDMYSDFAEWGTSVKSILSLMTKSDVWALFNHPAAPTYCKGRIAILGDAAHASTPHCGAGAGMAIEDVYVLSSLLGDVSSKGGIEAAFKAYDAVRRPRSTKLVEESRRQGQLYDCELVGDDRVSLKRELLERTQWIWNHDLEKDLSEARQLLNRSNASLLSRDGHSV